MSRSSQETQRITWRTQRTQADAVLKNLSICSLYKEIYAKSRPLRPLAVFYQHNGRTQPEKVCPPRVRLCPPVFVRVAKYSC